MAEEHPQEKPKDVSPPPHRTATQGGRTKEALLPQGCCPPSVAKDTNGGSDPQMGLSQNPTQSVGLQQSHVNHVGTLAKCPMRWLSQCWLNLTHLSLGQHLGCSQLRKPPTQRDTSPNGWQQPGAMNHRPARVGGDPKAHQVPTPHGMAEICLSLG